MSRICLISQMSNLTNSVATMAIPGESSEEEAIDTARYQRCGLTINGNHASYLLFF
jgi:hypothetical protein